MSNITQKELEERVAILRRFRTLLEQQRAKFQEYLTVLEKQEDSINAEDTNAIIHHAELEQEVVQGIRNLQKVIVPMNELYNSSAKGTHEEADRTLASIQGELNRLQSRVLEQNQKNRELLKCHLIQIRAQLDSFKNPYRNLKSVYATKAAQGNLVAVEV